MLDILCYIWLARHARSKGRSAAWFLVALGLGVVCALLVAVMEGPPVAGYILGVIAGVVIVVSLSPLDSYESRMAAAAQTFPYAGGGPGAADR